MTQPNFSIRFETSAGSKVITGDDRDVLRETVSQEAPQWIEKNEETGASAVMTYDEYLNTAPDSIIGFILS